MATPGVPLIGLVPAAFGPFASFKNALSHRRMSRWPGLTGRFGLLLNPSCGIHLRIADFIPK